MGKFLTAIICIALVALCIYGMWHGWRSRLARQANMFGSLKEVPERYEGMTADAAFEGEYVSTTIFGNWLDRVGFDSLGFKSKSTLLIYPDSVIFNRNCRSCAASPRTRWMRPRSGRQNRKPKSRCNIPAHPHP